VNYTEANEKLQGRCYSSRKLENHTYLKRRDWGRTKAIAVRLHATDVITFHEDGRIEVSTGGWDTVTTRDRINSYLPKPWHAYGERGATILSNYRWYAGQDQEYKRNGSAEVVLGNSATIVSDGTVDGGDSVQEYRERIRQQDNERNRLRSRLRYWLARKDQPGKLTVTAINAEENSQIRMAKINAYGFDRYMLESNAQVIHEVADYTLLSLPIDNWNRMTALKMACSTTKAVYISPVPPQTKTVNQALNFMFDMPDGVDYLEQISQVA